MRSQPKFRRRAPRSRPSVRSYGRRISGFPNRPWNTSRPAKKRPRVEERYASGGHSHCMSKTASYRSASGHIRDYLSLTVLSVRSVAVFVLLSTVCFARLVCVTYVGVKDGRRPWLPGRTDGAAVRCSTWPPSLGPEAVLIELVRPRLAVFVGMALDGRMTVSGCAHAAF